MKKNKRDYKVSILKCPICGKDMYVPRKSGRFRPLGHIKTMWCPICNHNRDFVESGASL